MCTVSVNTSVLLLCCPDCLCEGIHEWKSGYHYSYWCSETCKSFKITKTANLFNINLASKLSVCCDEWNVTHAQPVPLVHQKQESFSTAARLPFSSSDKAYYGELKYPLFWFHTSLQWQNDFCLVFIEYLLTISIKKNNNTVLKYKKCQRIDI